MEIGDGEALEKVNSIILSGGTSQETVKTQCLRLPNLFGENCLDSENKNCLWRRYVYRYVPRINAGSRVRYHWHFLGSVARLRSPLNITCGKIEHVRARSCSWMKVLFGSWTEWFILVAEVARALCNSVNNVRCSRKQ